MSTQTPEAQPYDYLAGARLIGPTIGARPAWAKALIVAEFEEDVSDIQTDYFATRTRKTVPLAWSRHTKDLFPELRKAAGLFKPTAHLGPGRGVFTVQVVLSQDIPFEKANRGGYFKGGPSHWHQELYPGDGYKNAPKFSTRSEAEAFLARAQKPEPISFDGFLATFEWELSGSEKAVEHREKYSMGSGYYLKGSCGYSTGWTVSKAVYRMDDIAAGRK
jgi:hypothetical protein